MSVFENNEKDHRLSVAHRCLICGAQVAVANTRTYLWRTELGATGNFTPTYLWAQATRGRTALFLFFLLPGRATPPTPHRLATGPPPPRHRPSAAAPLPPPLHASPSTRARPPPARLATGPPPPELLLAGAPPRLVASPSSSRPTRRLPCASPPAQGTVPPLLAHLAPYVFDKIPSCSFFSPAARHHPHRTASPAPPLMTVT